MITTAFAFSYLLDLIIGDPSNWPHPVRPIGRFCGFAANNIRALTDNSIILKTAGLILVLLIPGLTFLLSLLIIHYLDRFLFPLGSIAGLYIAFACLSTRSLYSETKRVMLALKEGDLPRARNLLSYVVGRETVKLKPQEIIKALLETIAENLSDGVIAPLFYIALGGPAAGLAFKAVSTMDSMIGYKNEKYKDIGWAAARTDDLLNFIPARITAFLITITAGILGLQAKAAFRCSREDGPKHISPNAGYPEAALAGALGVCLGGPAYYHGVLIEKASVGKSLKEVEPSDMIYAYQILFLSSGFMFLAALIFRIIFWP